jgi:hypothetical protein
MPVTVGSFDLFPSHNGQTARCNGCGNRNGLPYIPGVAGFFLGIVSGIYSGQTALHKMESIFGIPLELHIFSLVLLMALSIGFFITIIITKVLYSVFGHTV